MLERVTETPRSPKLLNPAISDRLTAVILRCLERDPAARYPTVQHLLDELLRVQASLGEAVESRPAAFEIPRKWLYAVGALACAVVAAGFYLWHLSRQPEPHAPANGKYVAVLPFRPIGSDPNLKYDAEGIGEAISSRLFSLNSVHPISPLALEKVDLTQSLDNIAQKVGANLVVLGTVQGQGDHISVTANVQNVALHKWVWSRTFSGMQADLLTIEDEIGSELIQALDVKPTPAELERASVQPTQNIDAYDLYLKGRDLLKNGRDEKNALAALKLFTQASAKDPSFALAWTGVADASLDMYRLKQEGFWAEKALAAAREARNRNDGLAEVHFSLGSVYTRTGKNAEAVAEIKRALQLEPNSDDGYVRLGRAYLATGNSDAALAALKKAVELNRYYWYNHDQLGRAYRRLGRNEEALKEFKRVVELDPKNPTVHTQMGIIYARQSLWQKCLVEFQQTLKLTPSSDAYTNLGTAYFYLGRYSEAISMFQHAVELQPDKTVLVGNLADAYRQAGQWEKAQSTYDRAIELGYHQLQVNPKDASTLGLLALYYARKGGRPKALELISRARLIDGADTELMYEEAEVNAMAGRTSDALAALQRALEKGYSIGQAKAEPDLESVRKMPEFGRLLKKLQR
jgi:tetratricopeptide (TPR) repeat protein